ncbi:MAG: DUF4912 domain-containing protein [Treponema sp.]|jgi:hypothetical protein|nr:DUF4912 domain-containing protein [Treponema sp.]
MEQKFLSRQQLESFSTQDLLDLADDYGIDIPQDLNRRFIIEEILESTEEMEHDRDADKDVTFTEDTFPLVQVLPASYNETSIHAILQNPAWAFVFWDIRAAEYESLKDNPDFDHLSLHIVFFDTEQAEKPSDSIDVRVSLAEREQYVLLSSDKKYFAIELACSMGSGRTDILAHTGRIQIPEECSAVMDMQPGKKVEAPELVMLSGIESLLRKQYLNHRQSFSK